MIKDILPTHIYVVSYRKNKYVRLKYFANYFYARNYYVKSRLDNVCTDVVLFGFNTKYMRVYFYEK